MSDTKLIVDTIYAQDYQKTDEIDLQWVAKMVLFILFCPVNQYNLIMLAKRPSLTRVSISLSTNRRLLYGRRQIFFSSNRSIELKA